MTACETNDRSRPTSQAAPKPQTSLEDLQKKAAGFQGVLAVPEFETTPETIKKGVEAAIATANARLDAIGKLASNQVTFQNTIVALDDLGYQATLTANRVHLLKETHKDEAVRNACADAEKVFQQWAVGLDYRADVFAAVVTLAKAQPELFGEDAKLLAETLRDYRRAGLPLPKEQRQEVERLRKELAGLTTDFQSNVNKAKAPVKFTKADLEGVPESLLSQPGIKTGADEYTLLANVTFQYTLVMENAKREATRRKLCALRYNLAREQNVGLLQKILELRATIAQKLGYAETPPDLDIDGHDAQHKIGILASLAHGFWVNHHEIHTEGIRDVSKIDMQFAEKLGYNIKLLGIAKQISGKKSGVQVSVYPTLIPNAHVLASVNGVFNACFVRGDVVGDTLFYGRGAGKDATASAVLSDVADAALDLKNGGKARIAPFVAHAKAGRVMPMDEIVSRYYVRFSVVDQPGVPAKISTIFAAAKIGISSVIQPEGHEGESVPLIFMIHDAPNAAMRKALAKISKLPAVKGKPVMFRVESFE